jgi:hypothetical protein
VIINFTQGDQRQLVQELRQQAASLRELFRSYRLAFEDVHVGSIEFKFTLCEEGRTFDSLAIRQTCRAFVYNLISMEPFQQLRATQDLRITFISQAKISTATGRALA